MGTPFAHPGSTTRRTLLVSLRDSADGEAWMQFEATYRDMLVRFCRAQGLQHADAEDAVQLVFTKLVTGLRRFEYDPAKGRFRRYLYRCTRSAVSDLKARPRPSPNLVHLEDHDGAGATDPEAEALFDREWVAHHYRLALGAVKLQVDEKAMAVLEATLNGMQVREIANSLGMGEAAVYKAQQRMRERLKAQIARQVQEEGEAEA